MHLPRLRVCDTIHFMKFNLQLNSAFAGSRRSPSFPDTLLALIGRPRTPQTSAGASAGDEQVVSEELLGITFTNTERLDFAILTLVFGVLVGAISAFSILINQIVSVSLLIFYITFTDFLLVCMLPDLPNHMIIYSHYLGTYWIL